jgi:ABC-2 type transport system permease protein
MNTQSNAMPESFQAHGVSTARLSDMRPFYWSVRRELWENRYLYIAPIAVGTLFLFAYMISSIPAFHHRHGSLMIPGEQPHTLMFFDFVAGLLMVTGMIVGAFYCLEAFQGERRDRSILFWKSLPVSDTTIVLSKASIPLLILPLVVFAITFVTQFAMLVWRSAMWAAQGQSVALLWSEVSFLQISALMLYHMFAVHSLAHAPFYSYFLLVSAWARRAALLWAVLPVIAVIGLESLLLNSSHFAKLLLDLLGGAGMDSITMPGKMPVDPSTHLTPIRFLTSGGLWLGLAITAACLYGAVRLRRSRGPQ